MREATTSPSPSEFNKYRESEAECSDLSRVSLAVFLAECGWPVFPCKSENDDGRRKLATTDPQKIIGWWYDDHDSMFGILGRIGYQNMQRTPKGIKALDSENTPAFYHDGFCDGVFLIPPKGGWQTPPGTSCVDTGDIWGPYTGYQGEW